MHLNKKGNHKMGIQVQRTENRPIPSGLYAATVESVEQETGQFGEQLKIKFVLHEEGFEGKTLTGRASLSFSPNSKLFAWVRNAVFEGRDIPEHYKMFDSDDLLGRHVILNVETAKGDNNEVYNKVRDVLPFRNSTGKQASTERAVAAGQRGDLHSRQVL